MAAHLAGQSSCLTRPIWLTPARAAVLAAIHYGYGTH
jgi:hypothetical protein